MLFYIITTEIPLVILYCLVLLFLTFSDVLKYVKSCFYNLNTSGALNENAAIR